MSTPGRTYDQVEYWDQKYHQMSPYDWLVPAHELDNVINKALTKSIESGVPYPKVLHIGSGSSELSFRLGELPVVFKPAQVYNVDFSINAIEWGKREEESRASLRHGVNQLDVNRRMKWLQASLVSLESLLRFPELRQFSLIVDKGTSDSVNIAIEIPVTPPFPTILDLRGSSLDRITASPLAQEQEVQVPAIQVLALNMAYIARAGAIWIAVSYREHRFDFLYEDEIADINCLSQETLDSGFPDTKKLWELEDKVGIEVTEKHDGHVGHRPIAMQYIYTLRRTPVILSPGMPSHLPPSE